MQHVIVCQSITKYCHYVPCLDVVFLLHGVMILRIYLDGEQH